MADNETGNNDELMAEFAQFLEQKRANEKKQAEEEDFDIEIWGPDGSGVRTKRSHAKPFLNKLGIDVDAPPADGADDSGNKGKSTSKTTPKTSAKGPESTVRKYFTGGTAKK